MKSIIFLGFASFFGIGAPLPAGVAGAVPQWATGATTPPQAVANEDIGRFWQAFDAINATTDPAERLHLIQTLYIDPGTPGLHALMAARRYTAQQYVDAIVRWPSFWRSVRPLTARAQPAVATLNADVARFRRLYPHYALPPSPTRSACCGPAARRRATRC